MYLFYNLEYYFNNPIDMFKVWEGGMSFHGALIGVIIITIIFSNKKKINSLFLLDIIACVTPLGLFFGRIANFINAELSMENQQMYFGLLIFLIQITYLDIHLNYMRLFLKE